MCGIVGYVGPQDAAPILLQGLSRLEYRGYDSAGVAVCTRSGLKVRKAKGRVADLAADLPARFKGAPGIGHTRWATHGEPTVENAHPQVDTAQRIAVVHNGIIENADELRAKLQADGVEFVSQTDTETVAHLVAKAFTDGAADLEQAVRQALRSVVGAYGLAIMDAEHPDRIVVARNGSPVLLGIGEKEMFVASDVAALIGYTRQVVYLDDGELATITAGGYRTYTIDDHSTAKSPSTIDWDVVGAEIGDHAHFLIKEIAEQPRTIARAFSGRHRRALRHRPARRAQPDRPRGPRDQARQDPRLRLGLLRGRPRRAAHRGPRPHARHLGGGLGVPLPQPGRRAGHALHRGQPVAARRSTRSPRCRSCSARAAG